MTCSLAVFSAAAPWPAFLSSPYIPRVSYAAAAERKVSTYLVPGRTRVFLVSAGLTRYRTATPQYVVVVRAATRYCFLFLPTL